jgi:hypothetical protein
MLVKAELQRFCYAYCQRTISIKTQKNGYEKIHGFHSVCFGVRIVVSKKLIIS